MERRTWMRVVGAVALLLSGAVLPVFGAATLTQTIDPPEANVGDEVTVTLTVQGAGMGDTVELPRVDGLQVEQTSNSTSITFANGTLSSAVSQVFVIVPQRAGDFTIPAFDIQAHGQVLHARAMKLHVIGSGSVPPQSALSSSTPGGNGPVVLPPANAPGDVSGGNPADQNGGVTPPTDPDGQPAKVFMVITPTTTDAYVGQTIPMRIEFYIRMDALAQQDSLPTIKGSDFLMNDLSVRPTEDELEASGAPYHRETWLTAISATRSGDFPLEMERDTYWVKTSRNLFADPLGNFFGGGNNLAHGNVPSNNLVIHSHPLPAEGRPANFAGAIGQFKVTGSAAPATVNVGDPAYLDFSVSGEGTFDQVTCPTLAPDPAWKSYVASGKMQYTDESHTQGEKTFHQAIIPRKNGVLPLPAASFSYFDPAAKNYVTVPIPLPAITVTGATQEAAAAPATPDANQAVATAPAAPAGAEFAPNRLEFGSLRTNLAPAYRQPWFWISQGALLALLLVAGVGLFVYRHRRRDQARLEYQMRRRSLQELEQAMSSAVQRGDVAGFFFAARQAVQVHWAAEWRLPSEAVTLPVIAEHDSQLAAAAMPLFHHADEILYSGNASGEYDLPDWERHVREELLQAQPA
jgi:hypothetical protein